jgi:hypothetical protein
MSESTRTDETDRTDEGTQISPTPEASAEVYREGADTAGVVTVGDVTVVLGYAEAIADRLEYDGIDPDYYLDIAPAAPAAYVEAMREAGARVHDAADLNARADGLYADGFSVAPGVGVVPCNPERTVLVRFLDRGEPVDLLFSNAPEGETESDSLSGALPLYGSVDTAAGGGAA